MPVQSVSRVDGIDELDRIGVDDVASILDLKHRGSVFRFLRAHPDFPTPKKFGTRLSWARGAVLAWVRAQPDRLAADPVVVERLHKGRSGRSKTATERNRQTTE